MPELSLGRMRIATLLVGIVAITLVTGCPPARTRGPVPANQWEALGRVNTNLEKIDQPVQYKGIVRFKWVDPDGKRRDTLLRSASLLYALPQYFLLDVRTDVGVAAQGGSNLERYWAWVELDVNTLWWGLWENVGPSSARRIPFPPNELLDALLLRPLPATLAGGLEPLLRVNGDDHRLLFVRLDSSGQTAGWREIRLDAFEPQMPREIIDRLPDGRVLMHAYLDNYRPIESSQTYVPRNYTVFWPIDEAEFRMDVTSARWRPDLPDSELIFQFPEGWQGERVRIDFDPSVEESSQ